MPTGPSLFNRLHTSRGELIAAAAPGGRLPTEPKLATMLGVSRATLREAMRTFETQGLIQRRQGVGTFVVHPSSVIDTGLELLESIESMAQRVGLPVRMGDYEIERRAAEPEEREMLKDSQVLHVSRVMEAEGRPIAYLVDVLPDKLFGEMEFRREFSGSVLDLLLKKSDLRVTSADTEIHAAAAESNEAPALHMQRGDVGLHFKSTLFSLDGSVFALSRSAFLS